MTPPTTVVQQPAPVRRPPERVPEPCGIVIFGASGDLAMRKIIPALFSMACEGLFPERSYVVGFARSEMDDASFRAKMKKAVEEFGRFKPRDGDWDGFAARLSYCRGDYKDPAAYQRLKERLTEADARLHLEGHRLFYLSTPPEVYADVARLLGASGLSGAGAGDGSWTRIIIEKPFGRDLESAGDLNRIVREAFDENQIYRIDHYLGKETVQNILVFRFANGIFEPLWNRNHIDHVQITAAESIGIEGRAGYYEQAGVLRDMFQNHMLQLVSLVAMEPPASFDATSVRNEKVKVLQSIHPITASQVDNFVVRGQYGPGEAGGKKIAGYREEPGVAPESATETFTAMRLLIDNWRWAEVPFYIRSGKRLARRASEISIVFKRAPHMMFRTAEGIQANVLKLIVQPDEGITLSFEAKSPGQSVHLQPVVMDFRYSESFSAKPAEAYERLIVDCMLGDATLFDRSDSVDAAWRLMMPILEHWKESPPPGFPNYAAGSWGPADAEELVAIDGHRWRNPGESS